MTPLLINATSQSDCPGIYTRGLALLKKRVPRYSVMNINKVLTYCHLITAPALALPALNAKRWRNSTKKKTQKRAMIKREGIFSWRCTTRQSVI